MGPNRNPLRIAAKTQEPSRQAPKSRRRTPTAGRLQNQGGGLPQQAGSKIKAEDSHSRQAPKSRQRTPTAGRLQNQGRGLPQQAGSKIKAEDSHSRQAPKSSQRTPT